MQVDLQLQQSVLPQAHALFNNCHASTLLVLPGGELICAWFGGEREGAADVAIWLARCVDGQWQAAQRLLAEAGLAHWNPVLHCEDGRIWLFYKVGATVQEWTTRSVCSDDLGRSWTRPQALVDGDPLPRGPVKNKLLRVSDGSWLAPSSIEAGQHWDAFVDRSTDRGDSWSMQPIALTHCTSGAAGDQIWQGLAENALWESDPATVFAWDGVIQPTLWESAPGQIHALMRSTRGALMRSDSTDYGVNWCEAYPTAQPNNNSGVDLVRHHSGALFMVCNPVAGNWGRRSPLSLCVSTDNGEHWQTLLDLESEEGEFSYPAIVAEADVLHVSYTHNRKNIVYCRLTASTVAGAATPR